MNMNVIPKKVSEDTRFAIAALAAESLAIVESKHNVTINFADYYRGNTFLSKSETFQHIDKLVSRYKEIGNKIKALLKSEGVYITYSTISSDEDEEGKKYGYLAPNPTYMVGGGIMSILDAYLPDSINEKVSAIIKSGVLGDVG